MGDKFCDTSLSTGNNDGTTKANAWWSLVEVLSNTATLGTQVAGDVIHVRTHDGTVNCSEEYTANVIGAVVSDLNTPTEVRFDDGTVWAGNAGVFRLYNENDFEYIINFPIYVWINAYTGNTRRLLVQTGALSNGWYFNWIQLRTFSRYDGIIFDSHSFATITAVIKLYYTLADGLPAPGAFVRNCLFEPGDIKYSAYTTIIGCGDWTTAVFENCWFDLTNAIPQASNQPVLFLMGGDNPGYTVIGGGIIAPTTDYSLFQPSFDDNMGKPLFVGFDRGVCETISEDHTYAPNDWYNPAVQGARVIGGVDSMDAYHWVGHSVVDWVKGESRPYLNATLPDASDTPWAWRVISSTNTSLKVGHLPVMSKIVESTGNKTITVEFLIDSTLVVDAGLLFAELMYKASDGTSVHMSSESYGGTLTVSTASWSNTSYLGKTYVKKKIVFTTTTAMKAGSTFDIMLFVGFPRTSASSYFHVCPDITIVAV